MKVGAAAMTGFQSTVSATRNGVRPDPQSMTNTRIRGQILTEVERYEEIPYAACQIVWRDLTAEKSWFYDIMIPEGAKNRRSTEKSGGSGLDPVIFFCNIDPQVIPK